MPRDGKPGSKSLPVTAAEVRHYAGDVDDEIVAQILRLQPTSVDLEAATAYLRGQGDLADRAGHPLAGKAAQIYEILNSIEDLQEDRR